MRTETFNLVGLDLNDPEAFELRWDAWVASLFSQGFRPSEEPIAEDETRLIYVLTPVGGVNDFNRETLAGVA